MKKFILAVLFTAVAFSAFADHKNLVFKDSFTADIKNLEINLTSEDITIKEIYGDEITIEIFTNNKNHMPHVKTSTNTLLIESSKSFYKIGEYCDVEICIPQDYKFKTIKIQYSSGDLEVQSLRADNILIESTSGDLEADSISADYKLILNKSSGDIDVKNFAADHLQIKTTSGSVKADNVNVIDADLLTTSGSIKFGKFDTESFDATSTSGSIKLSNITSDYYKVNTTSGSVNLEFANAPSASSKINSTSGSIKLYFLSKEGFSTEFSTNSGTLHDSINGNRYSPRGTVTTNYFGGGATIEIKTTSGSVSIEK